MIPISLPVAGLYDAYVASGVMGKVFVIVMVAGSIYIWTTMVFRFCELRTKEKEVESFRRSWSSARRILDGYLNRKRFYDPMGIIYTRTCRALVRQLSPGSDNPPPSSAAVEGIRLSEATLELVKGVAEESLADQQMELDRGMTTLSLGSTIAPLVGLLGTVWGILDAFQAMGAKGSALLSDVAPGLSSALLTTVVGLIVSIPSGFAYNCLIDKSKKISVKLDAFTDELIARISCEFGRNDR